MEGISLHVPLNKLEYRSTVKHKTEHPTPGQPDLLYIITTQGYSGEKKQPWPPKDSGVTGRAPRQEKEPSSTI